MKPKQPNNNQPANNGNRTRKPRQDRRTPAAGRAAVGNMAPTRTPEERRSELKQKIGRAVMTQVMERVSRRLNANITPRDNEAADKEINDLVSEYGNSGGDSDKLKGTLGLLDLDDSGVQMIIDLLFSANKGLSAEDGRMFFTEAHDSTQKIIDDIIKTGTARIVGPDGKLYDMTLIAAEENDDLETMPKSLSNTETDKDSIAGLYKIDKDNGLADNLLHGEIVAESKIPKIQDALDREGGDSAREYDVPLNSGSTIKYSFSKSDQRPDGMDCDAYRVIFGVGSPEAKTVDNLPATYWYFRHRTYQWQDSVDSATADDKSDPAKPVEVKKNEPIKIEPSKTTPSNPVAKKVAAVEIKPIETAVPAEIDYTEFPIGTFRHDVDTTPTSADETGGKNLFGRMSAAMRELQKNKAAAERKGREKIYNSVVNYFEYALPKIAIKPDGSFDTKYLRSFEALGSGEDSSGKVNGEHSTLMVVADGMGGHAAGDKASQLVVEAFLNEIGLTEISDEDDIVKTVNRAFSMMQKRIEKALEMVNDFNSKNKSDAGSTVVSAEVIGDILIYGSVGDSTIFVVRDGKFILVAGDRGGHGNLITNSIGGGDVPRTSSVRVPYHLKYQLKDSADMDLMSRWERQGDQYAAEKLKEISRYDDVGIFGLKDGDRVVLCTDGIMGDWSKIEGLAVQDDIPEQTLTDKQIVAALSTEKTPEGIQEATRRLISTAVKQDDRTVQMFDISLR